MTPFILSGGSGTRLWPVSRANYPKQFCAFYDQSFMQTSIQRLQPFGVPHLVTLDSMKPLTARLFRELGLPEDHVIYEPIGKNTAAPIALICHLQILNGLGEDVIGIFPADHYITDTTGFQQALKLAEKVAGDGAVVTLGIEPRSPETGYGYIEVTRDEIAKDGGFLSLRVQAFHEKPNLERAQQFLSSGRHFWNSGMFIAKASVLARHFAQHMPQMWKKIATLPKDLDGLKYAYASLEAVSVDYGVMEKIASSIVCIPCDIGWSDVGSWDEIARLDDEAGRLKSDSQAHVFSQEASGNYVFSISPKVVGLIGVQDLIVVETPDAMMIAKRGETQKVKDLVDAIKKAGVTAAVEHPFETRPWGRFEVLSDQKDFKVKRIVVDPGQQLSYQSHKHRDEHWVVIHGAAQVVVDDETHTRKPGEHIFIRRGSKHRMTNPGPEPLIFVEVQTGDYFGEDDITRYQDSYGR